MMLFFHKCKVMFIGNLKQSKFSEQILQSRSVSDIQQMSNECIVLHPEVKVNALILTY